MNTIFLRFPDVGTFLGALPKDCVSFGEVIYPLPAGILAVSIVGAIYSGGDFDEDGNVIKSPVRIDGYHVNMLGDIPDAWKQYQITPANPVRTFDGPEMVDVFPQLDEVIAEEQAAEVIAATPTEE